MIDLRPDHLETVCKILQKNVPDAEVRAFGSRVTGKAKPHSDLDLALVTPDGLSLKILGHLQSDFDESDLPFRVDIVDWKEISQEFRDVITQKYSVIFPYENAN